MIQEKVELRNIKRQWASDPCWDIEDTEGFEAHRNELLVYSTEMKREWAEKAQAKLEAKAIELGVPGNVKLAQYVIRLEDKINKLSEMIDAFE